jgi:hypothetical protein
MRRHCALSERHGCLSGLGSGEKRRVRTGPNAYRHSIAECQASEDQSSMGSCVRRSTNRSSQALTGSLAHAIFGSPRDRFHGLKRRVLRQGYQSDGGCPVRDQVTRIEAGCCEGGYTYLGRLLPGVLGEFHLFAPYRSCRSYIPLLSVYRPPSKTLAWQSFNAQTSRHSHSTSSMIFGKIQPCTTTFSSTTLLAVRACEPLPSRIKRNSRSLFNGLRASGRMGELDAR